MAELLRRGYQVRITVRSPGREQDVTEAVSAAASSYATEGSTDETRWTDPDDPALPPARIGTTWQLCGSSGGEAGRLD